MVIHGDSDPAVNHLNADRLVEMALGWTGDRATHHHTDHRWPRTRRSPLHPDRRAGVPIVERLTIHPGGHTWSRPPRGPHTDRLDRTAPPNSAFTISRDGSRMVARW
jgi:poly(3-hydroxybutyrate) depolymerase